MTSPSASVRPALLMLPLALAAVAGSAHAQCGALQFDGVDDLATVLDVNNDFDFGSEMTVEVWARVDVVHAGAAMAGARTIGTGSAWKLSHRTAVPTDATLAVSTPSTDSVNATDGILVGGWRHYAGTFDGINMNVYIDGVLAASDVHGTPGNVSLSSMLIMGVTATVGSTQFFEGAIDELRVWNVVRNSVQIAADYDQLLTGSEPGLVGYYQFDEGSGDVILDSSSAGNDGFLGATAGPGADDPTRVPSGLSFTCPSNALCFGDGSGSACPCGNTGGAGEGCANSSGAGAVLVESGSPSVSADDLTLATSNLLPGQPALLFSGEVALNGGDGIPFGDGLRCAGTNVVRLGVMTPDASGNAGWGPGLGATGGWVSGDTRYLQTWYRDPVGSVCGAGFNLSNAVEVVFEP